MDSSPAERLDIVVFGATGFTGKYAVHEVLSLSKDKGGLTWGVAGRNKQKLEEFLREVAKKTGEDLGKVEIIVADVTEEQSLHKMAARASVIVNCTGPYRFYGEPVVKACIANGTHHVDVSGEPLYMEKIQLEYHEEAEKKGVYVVSACGLDSIPADLGAVFLQQNFEGTVNSVETYMNVQGPIQGNYGTWASFVHEASHIFDLSKSLKKLLIGSPRLQPKLKLRPLIHQSEVINGWCVPMPGTDKSVLKRSQHFFFEKEKQRPAQVETYMTLNSIIGLIAVTFVAGMVLLLSPFRLGRVLLLKFPRVFSLGLLTREGPSPEAAENTYFSVTVKGKGWEEKLSEPTDEFVDPPNKKMVVRVSGRNPGYGATSTMLVMSAFMIMTERDRMPSRGGVYPPGAAFAKTSMIEQLNERGVKFEIVSSKKD